MRTIFGVLLLALLLIGDPPSAHSQLAVVIAGCGTRTNPLPNTAPPAVVGTAYLTVDQNGVLCTNASGSGPGTGSNVSIVQGGQTATVGTYGTAPGAVPALNVNASVTNANFNGQATMANSSPVVIASNQSNIPIVIAPSAGSGITPVVSGSAVNSVQLKGSAGNLYGAYVVPTTGGYFMVFNSTTLPANGATTAGTAAGNMVECIPAQANLPASVNYLSGPGEAFSTGIYAVFSSTGCGTLTASANAFIHGYVQ